MRPFDMPAKGMNSLSQDQADKILAADFRNLVNKVRKGRTLTPAERALIKSKAAGEPELEITEAHTIVELAAALGVTRRTITNWRKMEGSPVPKANGMHDVEAWREFMRAQHLNGEVGENEESLKYRKLLAEVEEREFRLAVKRAEYISKDTVRQAWLGRAGRVTALMRSTFEKELPPLLVGKDAPEIQLVLSKAIDAFLNELHEDKEGSLTP